MKTLTTRRNRTAAASALSLLAILLTCNSAAQAQTSGTTMTQSTPSSVQADQSLVARFAPHGTLRASINLGNPVLATLDPKRSQEISFTGPYVLIEGFYAVRNDSPITANDQVDKPGITVAVGKGSAYDLFLTRELHQATIVRIPTSPAVVQGFIDQHLSVAAGVKQQLEQDAAKVGGMRILPQRFMVIRQAMGVPKARGDAAAAYLSKFVEEMAASGFVAASLAKNGIEGAIVAKAGD